MTQENVAQYVGLAMGVRVGVWRLVLTNDMEPSLTVKVRAGAQNMVLSNRKEPCGCE
jgi:hypothetical protein